MWIRGNFFIPDARKYWIKPSTEYLIAYVQKYGIKHVISSGPPHSMHMIALGIKKKLPDVKWVADFRDPWTNIDFYEKLMLSKKADKIHHLMEQDVLQHADLVVSVGRRMSDEFVEMYRKNSGQNTGKFKVITNGFDKDDIITADITKDSKFSIAHIGTLVEDRNPDALWRVLSKLVKENPEFEKQLEIKLVGKIDIFVKEQLETYGLAKYVNKIDYLPHEEVIAEQQRSKVLLLLVNNTKNAKGILTGKFFEYMAANVPILAIGPSNGDLSEIIRETGTGLISDFGDLTALEKNILQLYSNPELPRQSSAIEKYSRKNLTGELAGCLASL